MSVKKRKVTGNLKRKHSVDNWLAERLWACRKQTTECMINSCNKLSHIMTCFELYGPS